MKSSLGLILFLIFSVGVFAKEIHVSKNGNDKNSGSLNQPLKTIQAAANIAQPGDVITVHEGIYREWVNPIRGGESDSKRIVYRAAKGEKVEIKGSELIENWESEGKGVWKVTIPNSFFGDYNPYEDLVYGDWFIDNGRIHHTGEVFLNGKALFEEVSMSNIYNPKPDKNVRDLEGSVYTWYCKTDENNTTIWANFQKYDPNKELVEISTRPTCFYPEKKGIDYITIQGFEFSQAATQWAAPTAGQVGMIATHWNKGWIIENNVIHDSKCNGITLGKEFETGHNVWLNNPYVDGAVHYIELVFKTIKAGWNKENVGSHIVRNNEIYNCEQTAICGSMGAAFCIVENNYIHDIYSRRRWNGYEMAGIKFHGAIDAIIRNNRINNCSYGIFLDWMHQGTRISKNLLYNNDKNDMYLEVNHGPTLVDNNLFLSRRSIKNQSQGIAFVHNLIVGQILTYGSHSRYTPYFIEHSTEVAGLCNVMNGDDKYYNNILLNCDEEIGIKGEKYKFGVNDYGDSNLSVYVNGNAYFNNSTHHVNEANYIEKKDATIDWEIIEEKEHVYLKFKLEDDLLKMENQLITTQLLGKAIIPQKLYENPDGTPLKIDSDFLGNERRAENPVVGPFEISSNEPLKLKVW